MICNGKWGSVRKVRYVEDILMAVKYASDNAYKQFSESAFIDLLIQRRAERNNLIQKHYTRELSRTKRSMYITRFNQTLSDTLKFLKEIKVFTVEEGVVIPLNLVLDLRGVSNERRQRSIILSYVLRSIYKAYACFLNHISLLGQFTLPNEYSKRDENATSFIRKSCFFTDVASFYTIRDILYELDVVNWLMDDNRNLILYPAISLSQKDISNFDDFVLTASKMETSENVTDKEFRKELVDTYLNLTGRRFMVTADLVRLRDIFCQKHRMGDLLFKEVLLRVLDDKSFENRIVLSFGTIAKRMLNYDLKMLSLPRLSSNRLALYITIVEKEEHKND